MGGIDSNIVVITREITIHDRPRELERLWLHKNSIGDPGIASLAGALSSGALPKLKVLFISSPSDELTALCSSESIKLNTY